MATVDGTEKRKQNLEFLSILTSKIKHEKQKQKLSWLQEVTPGHLIHYRDTPREMLYIKLIGKIDLEQQDPLWWDAEAFVWKVRCEPDDEKQSWYYTLTLEILQPRREIPQNKREAATAITQTKFYTATSLLEALGAFYVPLPSDLGSLTNIHERLKQLESLYQTRLAMMQ